MDTVRLLAMTNIERISTRGADGSISKRRIACQDLECRAQRIHERGIREDIHTQNREDRGYDQKQYIYVFQEQK